MQINATTEAKRAEKLGGRLKPVFTVKNKTHLRSRD